MPILRPKRTAVLDGGFGAPAESATPEEDSAPDAPASPETDSTVPVGEEDSTGGYAAAIEMPQYRGRRSPQRSMGTPEFSSGGQTAADRWAAVQDNWMKVDAASAKEQRRQEAIAASERKKQEREAKRIAIATDKQNRKALGQDIELDPVTGQWQQKTDLQGRPLFTEAQSQVEYDPKTGKPFQTERDRLGNVKRVDPDANKPIGRHELQTEDDPNIYRQREAAGWEAIDPEKGIEAPDEKVRIASAKELYRRELRGIDDKLIEAKTRKESASQRASLTDKQREIMLAERDTLAKLPPEKPPTAGWLGLGAETQEEKDARAGREATRKARLAEIEDALAADDERRAAEAEHSTLATERQAIAKGGLGGFMTRWQQRKAEAMRVASPEELQAAGEDLTQRGAALNAEAQAIEQEAAALEERAARGVTASQVEELQIAQAGLEARARELNAAAEQHNAEAEQLRKAGDAHAARQIRDQALTKQTEKAQFDALRTDPATAPLADKLEAVNSEMERRAADVAAMPDWTPAMKQAKQQAAEALKGEARTKQGQIYAAHTKEMRTMAQAEAEKRAALRAQAEQVITLEDQAAGKADPAFPPQAGSKPRTEFRKAAADALAKSPPAPEIKQAADDLREDRRRQSEGWAAGAGYVRLTDGTIAINPAAFKPEWDRGGVADWRTQLDEAEKAGDISPALRKQMEASHTANEKLARDVAVDAAMASDPFKKWLAANKPELGADFDTAQAENFDAVRAAAGEFLDTAPGAWEQVRDKVGRFWEGAFQRTGADLATTAGILSHSLFGWAGEGGIDDNFFYQLGQSANYGIQFQQDPRTNEAFSSQLATGLGSTVGFMLPGAAVAKSMQAAGYSAKAIKLVTTLTTAAQGAAMQGAQQYQEARAAGLSHNHAMLPFVLGGLVGTSEIVPVGRWIERLGAKNASKAWKVVGDMVVEMLEEAGQETFQQASSNAIAKAIYDKNRDILEGVGMSAGVGGTVGAIMSLLISAATGVRAKMRAPAPGAAAAPAGAAQPVEIPGFDPVNGNFAYSDQDSTEVLEAKLARIREAIPNVADDSQVVALNEAANVIQTMLARRQPATPETVQGVIQGIIEAEPQGMDPQSAQTEKLAAIAAVKLAQGASIDSLTTEEKAALKSKTPEGAARMDTVGGQAIITDAQRARMLEIFPDAEPVAGPDEAAQRQAAISQKGGASTDEAQKADQKAGQEAEVLGEWTARGRDGTTVSIPLSEAANESQAAEKLAIALGEKRKAESLDPAGELLDLDSVDRKFTGKPAESVDSTTPQAETSPDGTRPAQSDSAEGAGSGSVGGGQATPGTGAATPVSSDAVQRGREVEGQAGGRGQAVSRLGEPAVARLESDRVAFTADPAKPTQAQPDAEGNIVVNINPGQAADEATPADPTGRAYAERSFDEEMKHVYGLLHLRRRWEANGRKGTFDEFTKEESARMAAEIKAALAKAKGKQRKEAERAMVAAWNLYNEDATADQPTVTTAQGVMDAIAAGKRGATNFSFLQEWARQLRQLQEDGKITEQTLRDFLVRIVKWLDGALREARQFAVALRGGGTALEGTGFAKMLRQMEAQEKFIKQGSGSLSDEDRAELEGLRQQQQEAAERRKAQDAARSAQQAKAAEVAAEIPEERRGATGYVLAANKQQIPAAYVILDDAEVVASHDGKTFTKNPAYPGQNTRAYDDPASGEADKVVRNAATYLPELDLSNTPSADSGPPVIARVIREDGTSVYAVVGGNSRRMMRDRLSPEQRAALDRATADAAPGLGFATLPSPGQGIYRLIGTFDFREAGGRESFQAAVAATNAQETKAQGEAREAQIAAATAVPPETLAGLAFHGEPKAAQDWIAAQIAAGTLNANKLDHLTRSGAEAEAQAFVDRVLAASALQMPALESYLFSEQGRAQAGMPELAEAAIPAMVAMRAKGGGPVAEAAARVLANAADYLTNGKAKTLRTALQSAAAQLEMGEGAETARILAEAVAARLATNKAGAINAEATGRALSDFFGAITRGVEILDGEADMFGDVRTVETVIRDAAGADQPALKARRSNSRGQRIRFLQKKAEAEKGLTKSEAWELEMLERAEGQQFMDFAGEPQFALDTEELPQEQAAPAKNVAQLSLFARRSGVALDDDARAQIAYFDARAREAGLPGLNAASPDLILEWGAAWRVAHPWPVERQRSAPATKARREAAVAVLRARKSKEKWDQMLLSFENADRQIVPAPAAPVVPVGPRQFFVEFEGQRFQVAGVADARRKWDQFRDASGQGYSTIGNGLEVSDEKGQVVAHISYNGRVWKGPDLSATNLTKELEAEEIEDVDAFDAQLLGRSGEKQKVLSPERMSPAEFEKAADEGRLHQATGKFTPEERKAKTPLSRGEAAGYSPSDIAHFYATRAQDWRMGAYELVKDAQKEKRPINADLWDEVVQNPPKGWTKTNGYYMPPGVTTLKARRSAASTEDDLFSFAAQTYATAVQASGITAPEVAAVTARKDLGKTAADLIQLDLFGGGLTVGTNERAGSKADQKPPGGTETGGEQDPADVSDADAGAGAGEGGRGTGKRPGGGRRTGPDGGPQLVERPTDPAERNHVIEDVDDVAPKGDTAKWDANVAAIELLRTLDSESRAPTLDERKVLARYTGWGWAKEAFNQDNPRWTTRHAKLRELLGEDEFMSARKSSLNAHFTALPVIDAMWAAARRLGFRGGNVVEPAGGVGHFFGRMPQELMDRSRLFGVELDLISGAIMRHLYPEAEVQVTGFQDAGIPNNSADLFMSNVPFGNYKVVGGRDYPNLLIHDYFFARALDKLRPGGLLMFITSDGTMDKSDKAVRRLLGGKADLVGAVRLPNNAFKDNAGTEVTTDIIILRKKDGTAFPGEMWTSRSHVGTDRVRQPDGEFKDKDIWVNEYYANHPNMALGRHTLAGTMYSDGDYALVAPAGQDTAAELARALADLPENVIQAAETVEGAPETGELAEEGSKEDSYVETDDGFYQVRDKRLVPADWLTQKNYGDQENFAAPIDKATQDKRKAIASAWIRLRNLTVSLVNAEVDPNIEPSRLAALREALNRQYDRYVKSYGTLTKRYRHLEKAAFLEDDPEYSLMQALETERRVVLPSGKTKLEWDKADIFRKRIREPRVRPAKVETVDEAINTAMSFDGRLTAAAVADLLDVDADEAKKRIIASGRAFENPETGMLESREQYLSGNVREKLAKAEASAAEAPEYQTNVDALRAALPKDVPLGQIFFRLASRWIPGSVTGAFATHIFNTPTTVEYSPEINRYIVRPENHATAEITEKYGTRDVTGAEILNHALNGTKPQVTRRVDKDRTETDIPATQEARRKQRLMEQEFVRWAKTTTQTLDGRAVQEVLEEVYNRTQNAIVPPEYSGDYLVLDPSNKKNPAHRIPSLSSVVWMNGHRRSVVARILQEGAAMMAHGVGTGKTYAQIVAAKEMRRLGMAKKPMIVVQKATIGQFATSVRQAYPDARILVATEKTFEKQNRRRFMARIATGDYDMVIVTQPQFDRIMPGEQLIRRFFGERLAALEEAKRKEAAATRASSGRRNRRGGTSDIEKAIERLRAKMQRMLDGLADRADDVLSFEQLGVDALFIDEAHAYKKAHLMTNLRNVKGLPSDESQRAMGLEMKATFIQERNNGRNIILATGTPITNTIAEAYIMLRMATPHVLEAYGIRNFDDFAHTFGEETSDLEFTWGGKWKMVSRFKKLKNGQELVAMIRSGFDVKMGARSLGLNIPDQIGEAGPDGKPKDEPAYRVIPQTPAMERITDWILRISDRYEQVMKTGSGDAKRAAQAIPIVTMQAGMAAALDPRLVDPSAQDHPGSKVNAAIAEVVRVHRERAEQKGTQIIFADRFAPMNVSMLRAFAGGQGADVDMDEDTDTVGEETEGADEDAQRDAAENNAYDTARFNLYHDIRDKLVAAGIPANEIAIIHDYRNDNKRTALFQAVNDGAVRILIGSTEKLGVGVNVQERLAAIHHLDPPRMMTPAMLEQRIGRALRQGNRFARSEKPGDGNWGLGIYNFMYAVERSMDTGIFQMLENKGRFMTQLLSGVGIGREFEDAADEITRSMATIKALATGDERVMRMAELRGRVQELTMEREGFENAKASTAVNLASYRREIDQYENKTWPRRQKDAEILAAGFPEGAPITVEIQGETLTDKDAIASALRKLQLTLFEKARDRKDSGFLARAEITINGIPVRVVVEATADGNLSKSTARFYSPTEAGYEYLQSEWNTPELLPATARRFARDFPDRNAESQKRADEMRARIAAMEQEMATVWENQAEFDKAEKELRAIETALMGTAENAAAQPAPALQARQSRVAESDMQAYFDFTGMPEAKQEAARAAIAAVDAADKTPYPRAKKAAERDSKEMEAARAAQAKAYKALLNLDHKGVAEAIKNGVPLSRLVLGHVSREAQPFNIRGAIIESPADLAAHMLAHRTPFFESLKVIVLDDRMQVIASQIVSVGTLNESLAHPRETIAVLEKARRDNPKSRISGFVVSHNHPSGDPSPSEADRAMTRRFSELADVVGIPLLDHVVTNGESYFSFKEHGMMSAGRSSVREDKPKGRRPAPLPVLPKPEKGPEPGTTADWEALPQSDAGRPLDTPDKVYPFAHVLQTADPDLIHILNVDTRHRLISVDRYEWTGDSDALIAKMLRTSSTQGTYGVLVSLPAGTGRKMSNDQAAVFRRRMNDVFRTATIHVLDMVTVGGNAPPSSAKAMGLMEEAPSYGTFEASNATITAPSLMTLQARTSYHGTPHQIDPAEGFKLSKVGTGEGAQVYGWGLYFAENQQVAKQYAEQVKDMAKIDSANARMDQLAKIMEKDAIPNEYRKYRTKAGEAAAAEYDRLMEQKLGPGNLYTVELDVEPDELLDWDKPMSEHSEKVRTALALQVVKQTEPSDSKWWVQIDGVTVAGANTKKEAVAFTNEATGEQIYNVMLLASSPSGASKKLAVLGITGIQYLDQGSRKLEWRPRWVSDEAKLKYFPAAEAVAREAIYAFNGNVEEAVAELQRQAADARRASGYADNIRVTDSEAAAALASGDLQFSWREGTHNYVIFDESKIRITHKNGERITASQALNARRSGEDSDIKNLDATGIWGDISSGERERQSPAENPADQGAAEAASQGAGREEVRGRLGGDGEADGGSRNQGLLNPAASEYRDPRLVESFGEDWPNGWDAMGFPVKPQGLPDDDPRLAETLDKTEAVIAEGSLANRLLGLKPGAMPRAHLRSAIVSYFMRGGQDKKPLPAVRPKTEDEPLALFMGGGGASGKTSMLRLEQEKGNVPKEGMVMVNPDEVREFLPEYDELNALNDSRSSMITHEEASLIANKIESLARAKRMPMLIDGTMKTKPTALARMAALEKSGYRLRLLAVLIDPYEALVRAYLRAKGSKRYVPNAVLLGAHKGFARALPDYIDSFKADRVAIYDNSPEHPILLSAEDITSRRFTQLWNRQNLNENAKTARELLESYGEGDRLNPLRARQSNRELDERHADLERRAKAGDKGAQDEAEKIVTEAARAAGYEGPFYHGGTVQDAFSKNPEALAHYATEDLETASSYAQQYRTDEAKIVPLYIKSKKLLDLTTEAAFSEFFGPESVNKDRSTLPYRILTRGQFGSGSPTLRRVQEMGYDAVKFFDSDSANRGAVKTIAFFWPSQAKMAPRDAEQVIGPKWWDYAVADGTFTYDAAGKLIPLSRRFNPASASILRARRSNDEQMLMDFAAPASGNMTDAEALALLDRDQTDAEYEYHQTFHERLWNNPEQIVKTPEFEAIKKQGTAILTPEQAKATVDGWKQAAREEGRTKGSGRAEKVVLSLFDDSGVLSQPWEDAGYTVYRLDIHPESLVAWNVNVMDLSIEFLVENGLDMVDVVLAQPPCTDFASSGARWFKDKDADGRTKAGIELIQQTLAAIEWLKPKIWALENPIGRIKRLTGLPEARLVFDPFMYGDDYTKRTQIWGEFNADLPTAIVNPAQGSKIHKLRGDNAEDKRERSLTPEGFAYAFWMANRNYEADFARRVIDHAKEQGNTLRARTSTRGQSQAEAINEALREAEGRIPLELVEKYRQQAMAEAEGAFQTGRPDLAYGAGDAITRGVDQARTERAVKVTNDNLNAEAKAMLATDREGVKRRLLEAATDPDLHGALNDIETRAAAILRVELVKEAARTGDAQAMKDAQILTWAYRETGTQQARALGLARRDPHKKRADRHRDFLMDALFSPDPKVEQAFRESRPAAAKSAAIESLKTKLAKAKEQNNRNEVSALTEALRRERLEYATMQNDANAAWRKKVEAVIESMGITLDDLFSDRAELRLKGRTYVKESVSGLDDRQRMAVDMMLQGVSPGRIKRMTGLRDEQLQGVLDEVNRQLDERLDQLGDAALDVEKFDLSALFAPTSGGRTLSPAERAARIAAIKRAMGIAPDLATYEKTHRNFRKRTRGKNNVTGGFDINDPDHVIAVADAVAIAKGGRWVDYAREIFINNILSAPATAIANATGYGHTIYSMTVQRALEASFNAALRRPGQASFDEFGIVFNGIKGRVARAWELAVRAWDSERSPFAAEFLNQTLSTKNPSLPDSTHYQHFIPGKTGRVLRTPTRFLLAMDTFARTLAATSEVGAMALRLGKAAGKTGQALQDFVTAQVNTPGSASWQAAAELAAEWTFSNPLRSEAKGGGFIESKVKKFADMANVRRESASGQVGELVLAMFFPFITTPFRLAQAGLRKTWLGAGFNAARLLASVRMDDKGRLTVPSWTDGQKLALLADGFAAAMLFGLLFGAAEGDDDDEDKMLLLTGTRPVSEASKGARELAMRTVPPQTIRIGGRNGVQFSYARLDPFSTAIATTVDTIRQIKAARDGVPLEDAIGRLQGHLVAQIEDKTFMRGMADLGMLMEGTRTLPEWAVRQTASVLVPNLIRNPLRALDPVVRDGKTEPLSAENLVYTFLPQPFIAPPAQRDLHGREIRKGGNALTRALVPGQPEAAKRIHPADRFIANYNRRNPNETWNPSRPSAEYTDPATGQKVKMTARQYNEFLRIRGDIQMRNLLPLDAMLSNTQPTPDDMEAVRGAMQKATKQAREAMFGRPIGELLGN